MTLETYSAYMDICIYCERPILPKQEMGCEPAGRYHWNKEECTPLPLPQNAEELRKIKEEAYKKGYDAGWAAVSERIRRAL